jgi:SAM-dependent methyltransferase
MEGDSMTKELLEWLYAMSITHLPNGTGRTLEVGSQNVNGSPRSVFQAKASEYIGVDLSPGKGVDITMSGHELTDYFPLRSFDTVICCETLEHDSQFWLTVGQMRSVLKPGGTLIVTVPTFGFPLHRYPVDCYRFHEDAFRLFIFNKMNILDISILDNEYAPGISMAGIARK